MFLPDSTLDLASLTALPLTHAWDDDDPDEFVESLASSHATSTGEWLVKTSFAGRAAYALLCCEWVACRVGLHADPDVLRLLDAHWQHVGGGPLQHVESEEGEGVRHGPMSMSFFAYQSLLEGLDECLDGSETGVSDVLVVESLAMHVLPDKEAFDRWRSTTLPRIVDTSPYREASESWTPLQREELVL